ncbi:hypothetical protein ACP70R_027145 [Stipagrostis hirtigluma subsp. patula]
MALVERGSARAWGRRAAPAVGKEAGVGLGGRRNRCADSILLSAAAYSVAPGSPLRRRRLDLSCREPHLHCRDLPQPSSPPRAYSRPYGAIQLCGGHIATSQPGAASPNRSPLFGNPGHRAAASCSGASANARRCAASTPVALVEGPSGYSAAASGEEPSDSSPAATEEPSSCASRSRPHAHHRRRRAHPDKPGDGKAKSKLLSYIEMVVHALG